MTKRFALSSALITLLAVSLVAGIQLIPLRATLLAHEPDGGGAKTQKRVRYEPTWESLDRHKTPDWMQNAKLGLFIYGVKPNRDDWEAYWTKRGKPNQKYNYKWLAWDSGRWDPEGLAQTAKDMGARYVVFGIGYPFVNYPSRFANAASSPIRTTRGPHGQPAYDYVGEIAKAVRRQGLKFGIIYGYRHPGKHPFWFDSMKEVIDRYQPSTLWWDDDKLSYSAEELRSKEMIA